MTSEFAPLRRRLTESLARQGRFREDWSRSIFERVPRERFAPEIVWEWSDARWRPVTRAADEQRWGELVYHPDDALVTQVDDGRCASDGSGLVPSSSISSAGAVMDMLASLDPRPGDRVLEIGTGSGYNAALLCERVGESNVVSVEVDEALAARARRCLKVAGYVPEVVCADGEAGHPPRAPYDRLISTASVRRVPFAWLERMAPNGEIVTPWLPTERGLGLVWLRMRGPGVARGWFHGAETFMAVRGQRRECADLAEIWRATCDRARRASISKDRTAWARIKGGGGGEGAQLYGERDLLGDVSDAVRWWRAHGRPRLFDFGMTVTAEAQTVWLHEPERPVPKIS